MGRIINSQGSSVSRVGPKTSNTQHTRPRLQCKTQQKAVPHTPRVLPRVGWPNDVRMIKFYELFVVATILCRCVCVCMVGDDMAEEGSLPKSRMKSLGVSYFSAFNREDCWDKNSNGKPLFVHFSSVRVCVCVCGLVVLCLLVW